MKNLLIGLLIVCIGIGLGVWGVWAILEGRASLSWPTTEGTVTASAVGSHQSTSGTGRKRGSTTMYSAEVAYEYTVEGTGYASDRVTLMHESNSNPGAARAVVARYPVGAKVEVHYKPGAPEKAVLEPGYSKLLYIPLGLSPLALLLGVLVGAGVLRTGTFRRGARL